jgi:hypothetical protein
MRFGFGLGGPLGESDIFLGKESKKEREKKRRKGRRNGLECTRAAAKGRTLGYSAIAAEIYTMSNSEPREISYTQAGRGATGREREQERSERSTVLSAGFGISVHVSVCGV